MIGNRGMAHNRGKYEGYLVDIGISEQKLISDLVKNKCHSQGSGSTPVVVVTSKKLSQINFNKKLS